MKVSARTLAVGTFVLGTAFASTSYSKETTAEAPVATKTTNQPTPRRTLGDSAAWPRLGEGESSGHPWGAAMVIFGVLGAAGVSSLVLRKKNVLGGTELIEVLCAKTIAPRTKIVLLSARNREVLVSVNEKGATLLTEWLSEEATPLPQMPELQFEAPVELAGESDALLALSKARDSVAAPAAPAASEAPRKAPSREHSEAVAGLLELRKKAQRTPPKGLAAKKSVVAAYEAAPAAWPAADSTWTRGLMAQLGEARGEKG